MTFKEFKQQIDLLEETRRIVKQVEEEKRKALIENVADGITDVFITLRPYITYCTEACGLTKKEKCITYVERYGYNFVMKIQWTDDWLSSKIEIEGTPSRNFKTTYKDLQVGDLKNLSQLQLLNEIFSTNNLEKIVNKLTEDLYKRIKENKIYV